MYAGSIWTRLVVSKLWPDDPTSEVEGTVKNVKICKTAEITWWLQPQKNQELRFLTALRFGTVRSEVRILSPRPI